MTCDEKDPSNSAHSSEDLCPELQIRGGIEDNSKIIFLFLKESICYDPSLELSR